MRSVPSVRWLRVTRYDVAACSTALVLSSVTSSIAVQLRSSHPQADRVSSTQRRAPAMVATSGAKDCSAGGPPLVPDSVTQFPSALRARPVGPEGSAHRDTPRGDRHIRLPRVANVGL